MQVIASHSPFTATMRKEEARQRGLHEAVLIPFGVILDEHPHGLEEIFGELVFHTDAGGGVIGDQGHLGGMAQQSCAPSRHDDRGFVKGRGFGLAHGELFSRTTARQAILLNPLAICGGAKGCYLCRQGERYDSPEAGGNPLLAGPSRSLACEEAAKSCGKFDRCVENYSRLRRLSAADQSQLASAFPPIPGWMAGTSFRCAVPPGRLFS